MLPKQLQKPWFGTVAWLTMVYLTYVMIDGLRDRTSPPSWWLVAFSVVQGILVIAVTYAIVAAGDEAVSQAKQLTPAPTPRRPLLSRAYLVVHLDLRVSPPTVSFVHIYSCKASDLTMTGAREARADLYMVEADTFQEALDEMERLQPLYFPWVTPLMTRSR